MQRSTYPTWLLTSVCLIRTLVASITLASILASIVRMDDHWEDWQTPVRLQLRLWYVNLSVLVHEEIYLLPPFYLPPPFVVHPILFWFGLRGGALTWLERHHQSAVPSVLFCGRPFSLAAVDFMSRPLTANHINTHLPPTTRITEENIRKRSATMGRNIARAQLEINQIDQIASSRLGEEKKSTNSALLCLFGFA